MIRYFTLYKHAYYYYYYYNILDWKDQIRAVSVKVSRGLGLLKHAKKFLPLSEIFGGVSEKLHTILTNNFARLKPFIPVGTNVFNSNDNGRAGGISFPFHSQSARIGQAKGQALFSQGKQLSYLHHLRDIESVEIKSGDIVLIGDKNRKRGIWKIGIIEEHIVALDGITRGEKVPVTGTSKPEYLNRPLHKLYPLELSVGNVNDKRWVVKDMLRE